MLQLLCFSCWDTPRQKAAAGALCQAMRLGLEHKTHRGEAGTGARAERSGQTPDTAPPGAAPLRSARGAPGASAARRRGTGRRRREAGEAGEEPGGHPRPLLPSPSCFPPVFSPFVGCVLGGSDARRAAHPRRGSLFPASGLVLAAPRDGEGGGCRPAGMAVRMCPFGKSRSGGFFFWSVLGGDFCCSSVLQRVWAGGMPGWLVALDPLARWAAAGKRCTSGSLSSPGNMTKEDGSVPRKQVYWV